MYKFYIPKNELNDATDFYVGIVRDALLSKKESVEYITKASDIEHEDVVFTITLFTFIKALLKRPSKQIHWFQGITPEEIWLLNLPKWRKVIYSFFCKLFERIVLKKSHLNFFVSKSMVEHYRNKYGYKGNNLIIMPCFNAKLLDEAFTDEKYSKPSFVYAGNLAKWQCVEETLALFKKIKSHIPEAELFLFTKEEDKANSLLKKYELTAQVRYVPYTELTAEMSKIKYGFLIREDIEINRVATPTKMNTYLATGIIPVFSDVVGDFKHVFKDLQYAVSLTADGDGIDKLYEIEDSQVKCDYVKEEYAKIFDSYYSPDFYKKQISAMI